MSVSGYFVIDEAVRALAELPPRERTAALNRLLLKAAGSGELDLNARLVTALREQHVWPPNPRDSRP